MASIIQKQDKTSGLKLYAEIGIGMYSGVPGIPRQEGQATWTSNSAAASIHFSDGGGGKM